MHPPALLTVDESAHNGKVMALTGQHIDLLLPMNASAGFCWMVGGEQLHLVRHEGLVTQERTPGPPPTGDARERVFGGRSLVRYRLRAEHEGDEWVTLVQRRPFETQGAVVGEFRLLVQVRRSLVP